MSIEAYIPYDLRERLASQIEVIDKMVADAVAAERERCADHAKRLLTGLGIDNIADEVSDRIRKGE